MRRFYGGVFLKEAVKAVSFVIIGDYSSDKNHSFDVPCEKP
jgi:hypothetical protein